MLGFSHAAVPQGVGIPLDHSFSVLHRRDMLVSNIIRCLSNAMARPSNKHAMPGFRYVPNIAPSLQVLHFAQWGDLTWNNSSCVELPF